VEYLFSSTPGNLLSVFYCSDISCRWLLFLPAEKSHQLL